MPTITIRDGTKRFACPMPLVKAVIDGVLAGVQVDRARGARPPRPLASLADSRRNPS